MSGALRGRRVQPRTKQVFPPRGQADGDSADNGIDTVFTLHMTSNFSRKLLPSPMLLSYQHGRLLVNKEL